MIYLTRIIELNNQKIHQKNIRPMLIISIMLAEKIRQTNDDNIILSIFGSITPLINIPDLLKMEIEFLKLIDFNLFVKPILYYRFLMELWYQNQVFINKKYLIKLILIYLFKIRCHIYFVYHN